MEENLYHQYYELRYGGSEPSADRDIEAGKGLAEKLMQIWDAMNKAGTPSAYIKRVHSFRRNFGTYLAKILGRNLHFIEGEILIDIPPSHHDQIDGVYVIVDDVPVAIQNLSPLADAVRDTFRYWARKVRVFIAPSASSRFRAHGLEESLVRRACEIVMQRIAMEQNPQAYLFPIASEAFSVEAPLM